MRTHPLAEHVQCSSEAADMLLKKIVDLEQTLHTAKESTTKNQKAIDFYTEMLGVMKFAWAYMTDMEWIGKRNILLIAENKFLREWAGSLQAKITKYEVVEELKVSGDFEKTVKAVDNYINHTNDLLTK